MRKESFLITIIKWVCWSFVLGVGLANILGPQDREFMIKMWTLCGIFFILSGYLYFASRNLVRYTLIPALMVLGLASYQWRFDVTNPDHISNFIDADRWSKTFVRGTIVMDPDVRDWITHVVVKPHAILEDPTISDEVRNLSGRVGNIILFVSRMIGEENPYFDHMEYGDIIEISGALTIPMKLTNPHGFDYAKFLENKNIYASMYIGRPESIKFVQKSELGHFGKIKKFSYGIKDRMILAVKKTVPPPHSAFIGGVTAGARGGVPEVMKYDFQATGVAHVLALSGLHVGFLALILIMFFNTILKSPLLFYKIPTKIIRREIDLTPYSQKLIPLFVILVLIIFVIITGARPATVRASMMYSIMLVFSMWFGMSLGRAGALTIPMSAAIMLSFNSFLIYDASFALSFTAVWSIVYLSGPLRQIFSRILVGWGQVVFFVFFVSIITLLVVSPWVLTNSDFITGYIAFLGMLTLGAYFLEKKYPLMGFEFEGWWPFIAGFFCVQLSIQVGMMWPLSGVYFNRFPIAGMLANFIAIPLIGIIVSLGILGQLFTFIPVVGDHLALAMGATNTLFSGFFLWMARFFRTYFPYPVAAAPTARWLSIYYGIVMLFAFNYGIRKFLVKKLKFSKRLAVLSVITLIIVILSSGKWGSEIVKGAPKAADELLVTFLDVAYGNCILIQTPKGKTILIDGGARGNKRYWTLGKFGKGQSVVIPNLSGYNISKLDKVVVTNPLPENIGGLIYIMEHFNVKEVWDSLNPEEFAKDISYPEFLKNINDVRLEVQRDKPLPIGVYLNYYDFLNAGVKPAERVEAGMFKKNWTPHHWLYEGVILHQEEVDGKILKLTALNPPKKRIRGTESDLMNNSVVLKLTYGKRSFLFPSNLQAEGEELLIDKYGNDLRSDVLLIGDHGSVMASSSRFLDKISPAYAVIQYGYLKGRSFYETELHRTLRKYKNRGIKIYRTDKVGAVEIRTDGNELNIRTVIEDES